MYIVVEFQKSEAALSARCSRFGRLLTSIFRQGSKSYTCSAVMVIKAQAVWLLCASGYRRVV